MRVLNEGLVRALFALAAGLGTACSAATLEERFAAPPESSRLQAWWHWCGDNVSEAGVAADLAAMQEMDVGTAHVFSPLMMGPIPGYHAKVLSPEWKKIFAFAVAEAKRRGIRLGFHNCPGWSSSGGPWIRPEDSMKVVVSSAVDVKADTASVKLPRPPAKHGFYRDLAVVAFPVPDQPALVRASGDFPGDFDAFARESKPVNLPLSKGKAHPAAVTLEYAAAFAPGTFAITFDAGRAVLDGVIEASDDGRSWRRLRTFGFNFHSDIGDPKYMGLDCGAPARFFRVTFRPGAVPEWMGGKPFDTKLKALAFTTVPMVANLGARNSSTVVFGYRPEARPETPGIAKAAFVDLTSSLAPDGTVDLSKLSKLSKPPKPPKPPLCRLLRIGYTTSGKCCAPATLPGLECDKLSKRGLDAHWPHMPREILDTPGAKGTVAISLIDSYEVGGQNWTEDLPAEFKRRRGYDLRPYLPAVVGYTVGTSGETAKFLFDLQRTVAELFAENYYDYFAELCHREGILAASEAYGGPFDPLRCFRTADVPTGEFWLGASPHGSPRLAASAGHLNGRAQIGAEAFTTEAMPGRWQITPRQLKESGDRGWLEGISQLVYHSYLSQPFMNVKPGLSLGRHGTQLNRHTTWWKDGKWWSKYVRRGQFLLQSGKPRAAALVLVGDAHPDAAVRPEAFVKAGYDFDFCGRDDLLRLEVRGGRMNMPGQEPYEFLCLGTDNYLTLPVLEKVKALLAAGVKVAGRRPADTPSLSDDPAAWTRVVGEIWNGTCANLVETADPLEAAKRFGLKPPADSGGRLGALHRRIEGRDFYFLMNDADRPFDGNVTFAATGAPSRWDAKTGEVTALPRYKAEPGRVTTRFALPPRGSIFVGFAPAADEATLAAAPGDTSKSGMIENVLADLSSDWTITAFEGANVPSAPLVVKKLMSWSESADPKLKYFAGRAVYEKSLVPSLLLPPRFSLILDLGEVRDIANVYVNGKFIACLWEPPYRLKLPSELFNFSTAQPFNLRLEVVNTWPNRMIGDAIARKDGAAEPKRDGYPEWVLADRPDSGTGIFTWSNFDYGWTADDKPLPAGLIGPVRLIGTPGR